MLAARKMRREMAQKRCLLRNDKGWDRVALPPDDIEHLDDIVEMTLRIDAARERKPD